MTFSSDLRAFVAAQHWTLAKTIPERPHEYMVHDRVDPDLFERLVVHVRVHGSVGRFFERAITYDEEADWV